jgi:exonuclease VII large subunit
MGKPDESELTPIRSRRLKTESLDTNTTKEKKELDDVRFAIESGDGSSTEQMDSEDEEVIEMEKKLRAKRKQRKSYERKEKLWKLEEKKEKLRQEFAAEKERKKSKSKDKGEAFGKKFNLKDKYIKNNDKNVNTILELCSDSGESSCFVSSCSRNNFSDSENEK